MGKRKDLTVKEWLVPMKYKGTATAIVIADTAEEAEAAVRRGDYNTAEPGESFDWEIDGAAELNE